MSEYTDKIMKIFLNNKEHGTGGAKMVEIEIFSAQNTTGIAINNMRVTKTKPYGFIQPMQKYVVDEKAIIEAIGADVQPVKHGYWKEEEPRVLKCSVCGEYAPMNYLGQNCIDSRYCPWCGTKMDSNADEPWQSD